MDKELLKKHHFWVLLGVFLLPALAVAAFLFTSVQAATSTSLKKIDDHGKTLDGSVKSAQASVIETKLEEQKGVLVKQRMSMWEEAWKNQAPIYTWPEGLPADVRTVVETLPFGGDIVNDTHRSLIRGQEAYLKEYEKFTDEKKYATRFNGGWQSILKFVSNWDQRPVPTSEEIWLAFEDFWVQRELVRIVQAVNKSAATFTEVSKEEFPETSPTRKRFRNRFWEVELKVTPQADAKGDLLEGTIKNISNKLQVFGRKNELTLNVWLDATDEFPFIFIIEGDYLNAGDPARKIKTISKHRLQKPVKELARVEQVFDDLTVPVWRIDRVAMGAASNRTNPLAPKPSTFSKKIIDELAANAPTTGATGSEKGPGGMASEGGPGGPPGGFGGSTASSTDRTIGTGLERNRYVAVTNQVRRMQVGMVLILDQTFLPDVLEALANSKLRCQNTQYHWKRFRSGRGSSSPSGGVGPSGGPGPSGEGEPGGLASGGGGFGSPPGIGFPGFGPGGLGGFSGNVVQSTEGLSVSMIELSVYGIASLYEKFNPDVDNQPAAGTTAAETKKN